jgi:hypothetical protein
LHIVISYLVVSLGEQQVWPEQHPAFALHPLPSEAQQLAAVLQQSVAQQLDPSVQQLPSTLQALFCLQHPTLAAVETEQPGLSGTIAEPEPSTA